MSWMTRTFLRGMAAVLPFALTVYIVYWLVDSTESLLKGVYRFFFPHGQYWYGIGLALAIVLLFGVGILLNAVLVQRLYNWILRQIERIPFIKTIYGMLSDMMGFFRLSEKRELNQVVLVELGGARLLGFVTREHFEDLPEELGGEGTVGVYLPMSYQLGGYLVMLPRRAVTPVEMSAEEALRFAITAGVTTSNDEDVGNGRAADASRRDRAGRE